MYTTIYIALVWAFSFWMVADVVRRRLSYLWIALILLIVPPYGGLLYLVYLKLAMSPRFRGRWGIPASSSAPTPSDKAVDPELLRADVLEEQRRFDDARVLYEAALKRHAEEPRALLGLARCLTELGELRAGLAKYEALMALDPRHRNYAGALEYAEVLHRAGRTEDAIGLLDGLVSETGRFNHRLALAHYCAASGQTPRAESVLHEALIEYERAPAPEQEANRRWQRRIVDKLSELTTS